MSSPYLINLANIKERWQVQLSVSNLVGQYFYEFLTKKNEIFKKLGPEKGIEDLIIFILDKILAVLK